MYPLPEVIVDEFMKRDIDSFGNIKFQPRYHRVFLENAFDQVETRDGVVQHHRQVIRVCSDTGLREKALKAAKEKIGRDREEERP